MTAPRKFFRFLVSPLVVLHLILFFQWGLFMYTTLKPYTYNVPGRTYVYLRGHLIYSSLIREGRDGAWKATITHTTRPTPAVYAHMFFIGLGKLAAIFNVDPPIMYMASRMAAAVILFWSTYALVYLFLPPALHSAALLFILFLEPGPMLSTMGWNPMLWKASIFSYYPQVVAFRHFGLPHHTLGEAVGLLFIGAFYLSVVKRTPWSLASLGILGIIGTTILPPYFMIAAAAVIGPWFLWGLMTKSWKRMIVPILVAAVSIASVSLFLKYQFSLGYPWKDFNQDEKRWVTNPGVLVSYISTLLLYIPLMLVAWITAIKSWKKMPAATKLLTYLSTLWVCIPAALVPLSMYPWFPISNFRLLDGYNYVPAGLLAALGLSALMRMAKHAKLYQAFIGFVLTAMIAGSLFLTNLYTKSSIVDQSLPWTNVYLSNDNWKAFRFLETVPKMSGLLVANHFGEITPEFAPVRTFIGSTPGFVDWDQRYYIMTSFYSGALTDADAQMILTNEDIDYVFWGSSEKYWNKTGTLYPNLLTPVFESPDVTVFKVNKS